MEMWDDEVDDSSRMQEEATAPLGRRSDGSEAECGVGEEEEAPPEDGAENAKPNGGEGGG